jgi:hypothetical protein
LSTVKVSVAIPPTRSGRRLAACTGIARPGTVSASSPGAGRGATWDRGEPRDRPQERPHAAAAARRRARHRPLLPRQCCRRSPCASSRWMTTASSGCR